MTGGVDTIRVEALVINAPCDITKDRLLELKKVKDGLGRLEKHC